MWEIKNYRMKNITLAWEYLGKRLTSKLYNLPSETFPTFPYTHFPIYPDLQDNPINMTIDLL